MAGTTRDAVDVPAELGGFPVLFIDTAGLRQKRRVEDPLERIMGGRTAHAIDRCHLAILAVARSLTRGLLLSSPPTPTQGAPAQLKVLSHPIA